MKKELTKEELKEYVKKHGETDVKNVDEYKGLLSKGGTTRIFRVGGDGEFETDRLLSFKYYEGNFIVLDYKETGFLADEYEWLKKGDLVDVHGENEMLAYEMGLEIKEAMIDGGYRVYTRNKDGYWYFSALHIRPHIPEQVEEMTLEAVCKELGREIKIKK